MKRSIRVRLSVLMMSLIAAMVLLVSFFNAFFFEKYYINDRKMMLVESFNTVKDILEDGETVVSENMLGEAVSGDLRHNEKLFSVFFQLKNENNINLLIADSNMNKVYSNQADYDDTLQWLREVYFNPNGSISVIEQNDDYIIQQGYNKFEGSSFLEIIGNSSDSRYNILMQIPIESIQENVKISNRFFAIAGVIAVVLTGVIAFFMSKLFTEPIKRLSKTAQAAARMDFDEKYEVKRRDEIGILGESINTMSANLEEYISELKSANIELKKDIEKKEEIDEMRRDFISNVSHELKTPIALIQGYAEGLKDGINDDPESTDFYCEVIIDEANKMNKMVRQLLTLNSLESGKDPISMERFDVVKLLSDIVKTNLIRAEQKGATIEFNDDTPVYVWADEFKIEQVVTNYITNAINHVEAVGEEEATIRIRVDKNDKSVCVHVFNTGNQIPEADIGKVWDKFYKVDKARTREYGGTGVGLSIVKAIMDAHGRNYGVSNMENGVDFYFELDCENK